MKILLIGFSLFISFCGSVYSQQHVYVLRNGALFCHDSLHNMDYTFDSGAERSVLFCDTSFVCDITLFQPAKLSFALALDAYGKLSLHRKTRVALNIPGVCDFDSKVLTLFNNDPCKNNFLSMGMDVFSNRVISIDTKSGTIDYNASLPKDLLAYSVIPMNREWLSRSYYVYFSLGKRKVKLLVDLGFSGDLALKKQYGMDKESAVQRDGLVFTFAQSNLYETFDVYRDITLQSKNGSFNIMTDITVSKRLASDLIGLKFFLRYDNVYLDFKNGNIYLKGQNPSKGTDPYQIKFVDDKLVIRSIFHNSKEYGDGFRVGDHISIHGMDESTLDRQAKCNIDEIYREMVSKFGESEIYITKE